jgi:hypothetical protein
MEDHIMAKHSDIFRPVEREKTGLKKCTAEDHLVPDSPVSDCAVSNHPVVGFPVSERLNETKEESSKKTNLTETFNLNCKKINKDCNDLIIKTKLALVIIEGKQCYQCLFMATDQSLLNDHRADKHSKKKVPKTQVISCETCEKSFATFYSLRRHQQLAHNPNCKVFSCSICERPFGTLSHLKKHLQCIHSPKAMPLPCTLCDESFFDLYSRKKHLQDVHKGGNFCSTCEKSFRNLWNLKKHIETMHTKKEATLSCSHCEKSFSDLFSRKRHYQEAHRDGNFCLTCKKSFASPWHLEKHQKGIHTQKETILPCVLCNKKFIDLYSRRQHYKEDHSEGNWCPTCRKTFSSPWSLKGHLNIFHAPQA